jgi:hypothetical protein
VNFTDIVIGFPLLFLLVICMLGLWITRSAEEQAEGVEIVSSFKA